MSRTITGPVEYPDGSAVALATVKFCSTANNYSADGSTPWYSEITTTTDATGDFSLAVNLGEYRVLLQENGESTWLTLGSIIVEAGTAVEIGSLLEDYATTTALTFADIATQTWVASYVLGGGSAADVAITDLGLGTATAGQLIAVNAGGTAIVGIDQPLAIEYFFGQIG